MTRALIVTVLCVGVSGCAALQKAGIKIGDPRRQVPGTIECQRMDEREVAWDEERDVGGALALALAQKGGGFFVEPKTEAPRPNTSQQDQLNLAVAQVGLTVAAYSSRPDIPWTFGVLDSEVPNAFSTPGGYVLVTKGLLRKVETEAQLAAVLAHEVAHVALRHAVHVYRTTKVAQCYADKTRASTIGTVNVKSDVGHKGRTIINGDELSKKAFAALIDPTIDLIVSKGFAQGDELEADEMATDLLVFAGYDPREYVRLLQALPNEKGIYPNHPSAKERIAKVNTRLANGWAGFGYEANPKVPLDPRIAAAKK